MRLFILALVFFAPNALHANVLFNEIAWMGSSESANDEWIELYNDSASGVILDGWTIRDGGSLDITLEGTVAANDFFLLERTDDESAPGVPADMLYTGALSNSGSTLTLRDSVGTIIAQLMGGENWENIGGDNDTKHTAQRTTQGDWVTGAPTPGAQNVEDDDVVPQIEEEKETEKNKNTSRGGGGGPAKRVVAESTDLSSYDHELVLSIDAPDIAYVNQLVDFSFEPSGAGKTLMRSLKTYWNFGDTYTSKKRETSHAYAYPGEYIVVLEAWYGEQHAATYHTITVLPVLLSVSTTSDGDVLIQSSSAYEVDIGGYILEGRERFVFPKNTILPKRGSLTVARERIAGWGEYLTLHDTEHALVANSIALADPKPVPKERVAQTPEPPTFRVATVPVALAEEAITEAVAEHAVPNEQNEQEVIVIGNGVQENEHVSSEPDERRTYGVIAIVVISILFLFYLRKVGS